MSINRNLAKFAPSINTSGKAAVATITVTVAAVGGSNKYHIDGTAQQPVSLTKGVTYRFDNSDSSNSGHPLAFSTVSDGTHNSGSAFTTGITTVGTAGSTGAYVEVTLEQDAPDLLYYYCTNHSGMGGFVKTAPVGNANFSAFADTFTFPTSDGTANQVMQTDGSGTLSFATASGGGGGGVPSGSTMITGVNKTVYSNAPSVRLTADSSSDTTFYVCGGAQYRYTSGSSATNSGLRYTPEMTNPSGIVAGWGLVNQGGNNHGIGEDMNYTFVWDDGNNRFTGFPTGSTYDAADAEFGWGAGTTSYTSGGVTRYPWSYRTSSTASWTNINFSMYINGSILMSVTVKADEVVDFMMRENYSLPSPAPQARMFASKLTY